MTCPKCGLQAIANQKFCRSCGASLGMTTQPLAEIAAISDLERTSPNSLRAEAERGNSLVLWGFVLMFIGVVIGVVGKKLVHEDLITVLGVVISLLGMFLTTYRYLKPSRQRGTSRQSSQPAGLDSPPAERLPPGNNIDYLPSITERTTDLLKSSAKPDLDRQKTEAGAHKSEN